MAWIELKLEDSESEPWVEAQKMATACGIEVRFCRNGIKNSCLPIPEPVPQPVATELDVLKAENEQLRKESQRFVDWYANTYQPWAAQLSSVLAQLAGGSNNAEIPMAPVLNGRRIKLRD